MQKTSLLLSAFLLAALVGSLLSTSSCKHDPLVTGIDPVDTTGTNNPNDPVDTSGWPCSPDSVYFAYQILPILVSNSAMEGCHSAASHKEGVNLTSYAKVLSTGEVKAGQLKGDFWESITSNKPDKRMPPPPASPLSQEQIDLIRTWILQGAKDLTCNPGYGGCSTEAMSFSADIQPILKSSCTGCHGGTNPQGGIELVTYSGVVQMAQNGKLLGSVKKETGYIAMPPAGNGLTGCSIDRLQAWIDQGMLNN